VHAHHALATDEVLHGFEPRIRKTGHRAALKQVRFAGVHADVGVGYGPDPYGGAKGKLVTDFRSGG